MNTTAFEKKPLVLIADDDPTSRMLLRATITQWNYPTIEAGDGQEAWEILCSDNIPQLVTVDWLMPKIDGVKLCSLAKKLSNPPYMILLTGITGSAHIVKALESGADDFLTKPFNFAELRSRLLVGERITKTAHILELLKKQNADCHTAAKDILAILADLMQISNKFCSESDKLDLCLKKLQNGQMEQVSNLEHVNGNFMKHHQALSKQLQLLEVLINSSGILDGYGGKNGRVKKVK